MKNPIGIFDSGVGGLTVLRKVKQVLLNENLVYLGDNARNPYGSKSQERIKVMIKAIIFDWGNVLAPSDSRIAVVRLKKNFEFDETAFIKYFDEHEDDLCHTTEYEEFLSVASKKFNIPSTSIINALNDALPDENFEIAKKLSENYKIHILSNQMKFRAGYIKKTFDLSFFDKVFFSNEIGLKKPGEEIFTFLLKEINQKPENCLFIDDFPENITVAKKLGFNTILFRNLNHLKKELASFSIKIDFTS